MVRKRWDLERLRRESSYWRACILGAAAHLDLFTWTAKRHRSPGGLAAHFGGDAAGWEIFLDALCGMGLMRKLGGNYANTAFSSRHLSGSGAALLLPGFDAWQSWGGLASVLTTGKRPLQQEPFFRGSLKAERLLYGLHLHAEEIAPYLMRKLPLRNCRTLLDVGGGLGTYSVAFCRRYPGLQATLVEHPSILPLARRAVGKARMAERVRVIGVDVSREALPRGFDAAFVSNIVHGQGVDQNLTLLRKLRRSLNAGGRLIVRDVFINRDRTGPEWGTLFSVLLLLHTPHGRCYSLDEIFEWLRQAGFSSIKGPLRSSPLPFDPDSVLLARKS